MTGAAVKIIVISDINLAASLPLAISRTIARDSTIADAAPTPWINLAANMISIVVAGTIAKTPATNKYTGAGWAAVRPRGEELEQEQKMLGGQNYSGAVSVRVR